MSQANDSSHVKEVGFVVGVRDYLIYVEGLPSARIGDLLVDDTGRRALVWSLEGETIAALMLAVSRPSLGSVFSMGSRNFNFPLNEHLFGRVISPLGEPRDGKGRILGEDNVVDLEKEAPSMGERQLITEQFFTGISMIDVILPLGRGQRQLIFGEPRSGKTSFILDLIANQKGRDVICIYSTIGRSEVETRRFYESLSAKGGTEYTILVSAYPSDGAPLVIISPHIAMSIAEYFRDLGRQVLLVFDDMGLHAKYLREIALLAKRVPGRESYPGDIFYRHAHIFERAGNFGKLYSNGSITLLPVIETELENFTSYIPTNLMSSTDGHYLFSASIQAQGRNPSLDSERSVTRVGRQTQATLPKILSDKVRYILALYREIQRYIHFDTELSPDSQKVIKQGQIAMEILNQAPGEGLEIHFQSALLSLVFTQFLITRDVNFLKINRKKITDCFSSNSEFSDLKEVYNQNSFDEFIKYIEGKTLILEKTCSS